MRRDVFQAIADPTRRKIIYLLADKNLTLNRIAENFRISRPAISRHVRILSESGILNINQQGREKYCSVNYKKLYEITDWLQYFDTFWNRKLNSLKRTIEYKNK
jgi:DNA-binding transcriptional ArsR family regulator